MGTLESIEKHVLENIPGATVEAQDLTGDPDHMHLGLLVVSESFEGKSMLEQQRGVMDLLSEFLKEKVHAVQLKTMTPEQYAKRNG